MNMEPVKSSTDAGTRHGWPTDNEICALARDKKIPLSAEAYEIAQQYHDISNALAVYHLDRSDLNWCGFAQWSSRAVGSELKLGNHSGFLRKLGGQYHIPMAAEPVFRLVMLTLLGGSYGVGLSVANRSIFTEMSSFHTNILSGAAEPAILQVTPPAQYPSLLEDLGQEGRDLLRTAHSLLSLARSASEPDRSELILGASIACSAYEQKRVQPALEYVFHRPIRWVLQVSWRMPYYYLTGSSACRLKFYARPHQDEMPAMKSIEDYWVRMYSKTLWLKTAVSTIALGRPLIPPQRTSPLLRPASTFKIKEVSDLVQRYGPSDPADLKGVSNWLDYEERMRFIVAYFMAYQPIEQMFDEPRFRLKRRWKASRPLDPLGDLEIRKVPL